MPRPMLETLERRRLLTYVLPAFADRIGLQDVVNPNTTFEDNFDGGALDPARWQVREGPRWRRTPGAPAASMSWTHRDAVVVGGGNLELIAHNDPATGQLRSGWIQTADNFTNETAPGQADPKLVPGYGGAFEQAYGYWEARVKFSSIAGQWGAFWVHSYRMVEVNEAGEAYHPEVYGTEYDVAEHAAVRAGGYAADQVSSVVHANGYEQFHISDAVHTTTAYHGPANTSPQSFHTYGLLWTPTSVSFYLDGNLTHRVTDPALISKIPHVGILSTEIGAPGSLYENQGNNHFGHVPAGGYGPRETSQAKITVDYMRVWQLSAGTPSQPPTSPTLAGVVFADTNASGARDANEPGLAGRTVYLDTNFNARLDVTEPAAVTDGLGQYAFGAVTPGSYLVRQVLPTGAWQSTPTPAGNVVVTLASGKNVRLDFGVGGSTTPTPPAPTPTVPTTTATVTGSVFVDTNWNGQRDPNETAPAALTVYADANMNGRRDPGETSTTTQGNGTFTLASGKTGTIAIRLDLTGAGYTQASPGANNSLWTNAVAGKSVAAGTFAVRATGLPPTPPPPTPVPAQPSSGGTVSGSVFNDANRNGRRDSTEAGQANVVVYLDLNMNGSRETTEPSVTTASAGSYSFSNVRAGPLPIRLALAGTTTQTSPGSSNAIWVAVVTGATHGEQNFGVAGPAASPAPLPPPPAPSGGATISGTVFNDLNRNGRLDAGETGQGWITVYLDLNMNGIRDGNDVSASTGAGGTYTFSNVRAGAVPVRLALSGTSFTRSSPTDVRWISATNGVVHGGQDFGIVATGTAPPPAAPPTVPPAAPPTTATPSTAGASISGSVFADWNRNGVRDSGEPMASGILVWVDYNMNGLVDASEPSVRTGSTGWFGFTNVRAAPLVVRLNLAGTGWAATNHTTGLWRTPTAGTTISDLIFAVGSK